MRYANVRNQLKYICLLCIFLRMVIVVVILTALRRLSLTLSYTRALSFFFFSIFFFSGLRSASGVQCKRILRKLNKLYSTLFNHSYNTDVESNMLRFLYSFLSPSCWSDVAEDSTVNPLAALKNLL